MTQFNSSFRNILLFLAGLLSGLSGTFAAELPQFPIVASFGPTRVDTGAGSESNEKQTHLMEPWNAKKVDCVRVHNEWIFTDPLTGDTLWKAGLNPEYFGYSVTPPCISARNVSAGDRWVHVAGTYELDPDRRVYVVNLKQHRLELVVERRA